MILDLAKMPRGAKSPGKCRFENKPRYLNLIHVRRTRGWWPARRKIIEGDYELTVENIIIIIINILNIFLSLLLICFVKNSSYNYFSKSIEYMGRLELKWIKSKI